MNAQATQQSSGFKITPGDVIYSIFRHKKKIVLFVILGLITGVAIYKAWPESYTSNAKILVKYVTENREIISDDGSSRTVNISSQVMGTELAILRSADLAQELNETVPELTDAKANASAIELSLVNIGLESNSSRGSNIINLYYTHTNREVPQRALQEVISIYMERHFHIHQDRGSFDEFLTQQTDQAKARLLQTEEELINARRKAGLVSVPEARRSLVEEIARIRQSINITKTELSESQSIYEQLSARTNFIQNGESSSDSDSGDALSVPEDIATQAIRDFERKRTQLEILKSREKNLLTRFTPESTRYQSLIKQISSTEDQLKELVENYPELFDENSLNERVSSSNPEEIARETRLQLTKVNSLQSRLKQLETQLVELQNEAARIDQVELSIKDLERRKALEESNYKTLVANLEKNRLSDAQTDGRVSNITVIQNPTTARLAQNQKTKTAGGIAGGIAAIGLVWALLVDLLLDRSIKRPTEIQRNLGIPLFMSLPDVNSKRFRKLSGKAPRQLLLRAGRSKQQEASKTKEKYEPKSPTLKAAALSKPNEYGNTNDEKVKTIAPWDENHALGEHFEGLRDKVITYFESKNLTHKPKLIGMTGVGQGSGVTTIASGLAGSLSKIGEGNVLLVDMTLGHETAQQFYKGKNLLNLDEVLEASEDAKMENNLYVVAEGSNGVKLPRILPQRFNKIMPKLRTSDFDYIIFDLPPVSPISSTPRISSFMDIVLMVMESEQTSRDVATQALELLGESKAHLGGVLNKTKPRVPRKLEQDLLSQA